MGSIKCEPHDAHQLSFSVVHSDHYGGNVEQQQQISQVIPEETHQTSEITEKQFKCPVKGCKKAYDTHRGFTSHKSKAHKIEGNGRTPGRDLEMETPAPDSHLVGGTTDSVYVCPFPGCGKSFSKSRTLSGHKYRKHGAGSQRKKSATTPSTDVEMQDKVEGPRFLALGAQLDQANPDKTYVCPYPGCGKFYYKPDSLRKHKNTKHKDGSLQKTPAGTPAPEPEMQDQGFTPAGTPASIQKALHQAEKTKTLASYPVIETKTPNLAKRAHKCAEKGCEKSYDFPEQLKNHSRVHRAKSHASTPAPEPNTQIQVEKSFKCAEEGCGKCFDFSEQLKAHARKHRAKIPKTRALIPAVEAKSQIQGETEFKCTEEGCGASFGLSEQLTKHFDTHRNTQSFRCPEEGCKKSYPRESRLAEHLATKHSKDKTVTPLRAAEDKPMLVCPKENCGNSYRSARSLEDHIRKRHPDGGAYKCAEQGCEQSYELPGALYEHISTHHRIPKPAEPSPKPRPPPEEAPLGQRFVCTADGCGKAYPSQKSLSDHRWHHHREKGAWKCEVIGCERAYISEIRLAKHQLNNHQITRHIEDMEKLPKLRKPASDIDKPYKCELCDNSYTSEGFLENHMHDIHQVPKKDKTKPDKAFKCKVPGCRRSYDQLKHLLTHSQMKHKDDTSKAYNRSVRCAVESCLRGFFDEESLAEHVAKRHQPKPSKEPKGKQGRKKHQQAQSEAENEAGEVPELRERASTVTIKQIHHMGRQADITSHISASAVKLKPLPLLQRSYTPHSARSRLFESSTDIERARRAQTQPLPLLPRTPRLTNARMNAEIRREFDDENRRTGRTLAPKTPGRNGASSFARNILVQSYNDQILPTPRRRQPRWSFTPSSKEPSLVSAPSSPTPSPPPRRVQLAHIAPADTRSPSTGLAVDARLPNHNPDDSDEFMSDGPEDLYVPKRSLHLAPAMSFFGQDDLDKFMRFPQEILTGMVRQVVQVATKKRKRGSESVAKTMVVKIPVEESEAAEVYGVEGENEFYKLAYHRDDEEMEAENIRPVRDRYGREDLVVRLAREKSQRGLRGNGDFIKEVPMLFRTSPKTPDISTITRQGMQLRSSVIAAETPRPVKPYNDRSLYRAPNARKKPVQYELPGKKKRAYKWKTGGKRGLQIGILASMKKAKEAEAAVAEQGDVEMAVAEDAVADEDVIADDTLFGDENEVEEQPQFGGDGDEYMG